MINIDLDKVEIELKSFTVAMISLCSMWYSILCYFKPSLVAASNTFYPYSLTITLSIISFLSAAVIDIFRKWYRPNAKITHIDYFLFTAISMLIAIFCFIKTSGLNEFFGVKKIMKDFIIEYIKTALIFASIAFIRGLIIKMCTKKI